MNLAASWRDASDQPTTRPNVPSHTDTPFYQAIGAFQGATYERNAFAKHTDHEATWLWDTLALTPAMRLLDVGCGTGRHLRAFAARGLSGVGIDVSKELLHAGETLSAGLPVTFHAGEAAAVLERLESGPFDVVLSLHQGAVGISPDGDRQVLQAAARQLKAGGTFAVTFFHALFAARHLVGDDAFDPVHGVHHQRTEVYGPDHQRQQFDFWTTAYTVREAVGLLEQNGLTVTDVRGVEPGAFDKRHAGEVGVDDPEFLLIATR
jgi:SAM-dependent methyltransferase